MYTITKKVSWCAAHRLEGHSKCHRLHGHNYLAEVAISAEGLEPDSGMLMDFGRLKILLAALTEDLDHRYIISQDNHQSNCRYLKATGAEWPFGILLGEKAVDLVDKYPAPVVYGDAVFLPLQYSTAEEIAKWLANRVAMSCPENITQVEVTLWETPKSKAVYQLSR